MSVRFESLEYAMQETLDDINCDGFEVSPRGRVSKEILGHGYTLTNPRHRIMSFKARNLNPFYLVGNLLWVLRQSNKLDIINYYNDKGSNFSEDGEILPAAYGKRIFDTDGVNQWEQAYKELKLDPNSRRALINIHMAQYDWRGYLDTSCTSDFQFLIRDNKLHVINHMRSQSAAFVQPYDVFLMTMLQELMAVELGVELGGYQHFCNSYHYFVDEQSMVDDIYYSIDYSKPMPQMIGGMAEVKKLLTFEKMARENARDCSSYGNVADYNYLISELNGLKLKPYWYNIGEVLVAKAIHSTCGNKNEHYKSYISLMNNTHPFKKLLTQYEGQ